MMNILSFAQTQPDLVLDPFLSQEKFLVESSLAPAVVVDDVTLKWMGYDSDDVRQNQRDFSELLQKKGIPEEERGAQEHDWSVLTMRDFKIATLWLPTKKAGQIRSHFVAMEKLLTRYMLHLQACAGQN